ncbi:MAG: hypothetical protein ABF649_19400 [Bacillus sp. (in: firmicutes)]
MAFGINRKELLRWKKQVDKGEISFLTHYWLDNRFPKSKTVTKVGCSDLEKLINWGKKYGLKKEWIHQRKDGYSHFDLVGDTQKEILKKEKITVLL